MNLEHARKTRFSYFLGVFLKFSHEYPCHFYRGVLPPPPGNSFSPGGPPNFVALLLDRASLSLPELAMAKIL